MPGAYYTRQHFYDSRKRIGSGSYQAFAGSGFNSDFNAFSINGTSIYDFDIWDNACLY